LGAGKGPPPDDETVRRWVKEYRKKKLTFGALRKMLLGLGFHETVLPTSQTVFVHAPSDTLLAYRPYRPREELNWHDSTKTRKFLIEKGIVAEDEYEDLLDEALI